ncbi:MAG: alpha/beta hydrolase [Chloroflexi bacterium]|nr:alpha/beta hydrolase [Chloroflexota bacterium]
MNHFDLGGSGAPLHFLHANGYPPECYQPLFELLKKQHHVFGMKLRPLWDGAKPDDLQSWHPLSDDLLRFLSIRASTSGLNTSLEKQSGPFDPPLSEKQVIGVGHSIGGIVTLRAALRDPKKFRAIILLDPVLFMPSYLVMWNLVRAVGLGEKLHPLISAAKRRRREFDDLETVFLGYRNRGIFKYMSDESLRAYIEGITKPKAGGGFELAYSPEWESRIYLTGLRDFDLWRGLFKLETPTLIIRGAETDTFLEKAANLVKKKNPKIQIETMQNATHILPLEHPQEVAEIINKFLQDLQ